MPLTQTSRGQFWYADHRLTEETPPLILIHGAGGSHLDYPPPLRRLNGIVLDLSGHGRSPGAGQTQIEDYALDVVALMDALQLSSAVIAGHSMGGAIAQMLALNHAERVKGLVLLVTAAILPVSDVLLNSIQKNARAALELVVKWSIARSAPDKLRQQSMEQLLKTDPAVIHGDYVACNAFDVRDRLPKITQPALIIGGTADKMVPPEGQQALADAIPQSTLHLIEDAGHLLTLEKTDIVTEIVRIWLETL